MKERPILFQGAMVRAILARVKKQTRRIVKGSEKWPVFTHHATMLETRGEVMAVDGKRGTYGPTIKCPYGKVGDQLWVREAFAKVHGQTRPWIETDYRATYKHGDRLGDSLGTKKRWTPSIHMPRAASRISLEVTAVRVERLQEISEDDAVAEGIQEVIDAGVDHDGYPRDAYRSLWEKINGAGSWAANPWVWVVEFKVVKP